MMKLISNKQYYVVVPFICLFALAGCVSSEIRAQQKLYAAEFCDSVLQNWNGLLQDQTNRAGKVILQFHLTYDGHIADMKVVKDSVGNGQALVCQKAVLALAPYPHWPEEKIHPADTNYHVFKFVFTYN